jgi:hypothetical protein
MQFAQVRVACGFPQASQKSSIFGGGSADAVDARVDAEVEEAVVAVEEGGSGGQEEEAARRSKERSVEDADEEFTDSEVEDAVVAAAEDSAFALEESWRVRGERSKDVEASDEDGEEACVGGGGIGDEYDVREATPSCSGHDFDDDVLPILSDMI